ncbi:hypothetical protein SNEBB_003993 [Seison nebaliae]|nr:hypothetical protein SNEBB_003993 [Seison nebaliae]
MALKDSIMKTLHRTKQKIRKGLGKTENVDVDAVDTQLDAFYHQQMQASHLKEELKDYIHHMKRSGHAHIRFYNSLREIYESNWPGFSTTVNSAADIENIILEYEQKMSNLLQNDVTIYKQRFKDVKILIDKRKNRLLDYELATHQYQEARNSTKDDETKKTEAHEEMIAAQAEYKLVHHEMLRSIEALQTNKESEVSSILSILTRNDVELHQKLLRVTGDLVCAYSQMQCAADGIPPLTSSRNSAKSSTPNTLNQPNYVNVVNVLEKEKHEGKVDEKHRSVSTTSASTTNSKPVNAYGDINIIERRKCKTEYVPLRNDELHIRTGDTIVVIEAPNVELVEKGWLYGFVEKDDINPEKILHLSGVFPMTNTELL